MTTSILHPSSTTARRMAVVAAALGYFVDIYDLVLFSIVRQASLQGIGIPKEQQLDAGVFLLNMQMGGMLLGGILWGVLGDRRGRLSVLFGSIFLYSVANIANAFVHSVEAYAAVRVIAGMGLAGELGAGITLVSELFDKSRRGAATTVVAAFGVCGAVFAGFLGEHVAWENAYIIGGVLGFVLLALRIGVSESGMFRSVVDQAVSRGNFFMLFRSWQRVRRYLAVIVVALPVWLVIGILVTFGPEIGKAMGMTELPTGGRGIMFTYGGLTLGNLGSGLLSQWLASRKKSLLVFLVFTAVTLVAYFTWAPVSTTAFYAVCFLMGCAVGYWAVFITVAAEQFGTNIRSTAATTVPNFVRGMVLPMTWMFQGLKALPAIGTVHAAQITAAVMMVLAFISLTGLDETYGKDLDFVET